MNKVLIVTYYWPPAGGIEVQRVVKFCKYLPELGWQPIILSVQDGNFSCEDSSLASDVNSISSIYRAKSWEPHAIYHALVRRKNRKIKRNYYNNIDKRITALKIKRLSEYIRLNMFIPDSRIGWLKNGVKVGIRAIQELQPDIIFSTSPPFTTHLIGKRLKQRTGLPWVVDFRDPWLENTMYNTVPRLSVVKNINAKLERSTLLDSDKVITVGTGLQSLLMSKIPDSEKQKVKVITNGYDNVNQSVQTEPLYNFYLSYYGSLYWRRFPYVLFRAIRDLSNESEEFFADFKLRFVGSADEKVNMFFRDTFRAEQLEMFPYMDNLLIANKINQPQLLILSIDNVPQNQLIVTGKIFDYITTGNPIVGVGPVAGDAASVLKTTGTGQMFDYKNYEGIKDFIKNQHRNWKLGNLNSGHKEFPVYTRRNLTIQLSEIFKECIER